MILLVCFGNPLLDISLNIKGQDESLLRKYNLQPDDQKEITKDDMKCLFDDIKIKGFELSYSPGGCAQNTARIFQSLQKQKESSCIVGAIGTDEQGKNLKSLVEKNGVITKYTEVPDEPTGTSIALINGSKRSLVAYLGAAECLNPENINLIITDLISNGQLFYMEGFFVTKRVKLASLILTEVTNQKKTFVFNISAKYLCGGEYHSIIQDIARKCHVLFGNLNEFEMLKQANGFEGCLNDYLTHLGEGDVKNIQKITVVTNGPGPVLVYAMGKFTEYSVPPLDKTLIKDTTGAGDAFVAGFLYAHLLKQSHEICVQFGCEVSREVIQNIGCLLRKNKSSEILQKYTFLTSK